MDKIQARFVSLLPLLLFLGLFVGSGLYFSVKGVDFAFYQISPNVAILPAIVLAILIGKGPIKDHIHSFVKGVRDENIILMCLIYLLAGAFSEVTKGIGSVEATVNFGLAYLPKDFILVGIFLISSFLSTAMGTAMGTVATVTPIAVGIASQAELSCGYCVGAVVSGAMFGDNLSFISDTTIASVLTQGARLREKFILNAYFAFPAMILTVLIMLTIGKVNKEIIPQGYDLIKLLPYAIIIGLAMSGVNVLMVLMIGIFSAGLIGLWQHPSYELVALSKQIATGFTSMHEILILSLLTGGLSLLIHDHGGLTWLIQQIERGAHFFSRQRYSRRAGEISISAITSLADICTANNTVSIILTGSIVKDLSEKHKISPERAACLIDIFSCAFQGVLPYGAQLLLASSISGISPLALVPTVIYSPVLGTITLIGIILGWPKAYLSRINKQ
jgi:Na+/H+ antiporter NhaC